MALMSSNVMDRGVLTSLLQSAIQAPSSHNTQPWAFRVHNNVIDLRADRTRALPVNDPDDRELTISCGCALLNLRIAAAVTGWAVDVGTFPDMSQPDLLARVTLSPSEDHVPDAKLGPFIAQRRTYRSRFADQRIPAAMLDALLDAVQSEAATLHVPGEEPLRHALAKLVEEGDAAQWANPDWRRELAAWMRSRRRGDGLTMPALIVPFAQAWIRSFDMGRRVAAKDRALAEGSPVLAVLATAHDAPRDWLAAGQALQRLLLTAVQHGLQVSYLNQPVQVAALRPRLQQLLGRAEFPQLLLRVGVPESVLPATPRRALADMVEWS